MGILDFDDWWFISRLAIFSIGKLVLWHKAWFVARANCLNHIKSNKRAKGKAIGICILGRFLGPRPLKVAVNSLTTTKRRKGWFHKSLMTYQFFRFSGQKHVPRCTRIPSILWYNPYGQLYTAGAVVENSKTSIGDGYKDYSMVYLYVYWFSGHMWL